MDIQSCIFNDEIPLVLGMSVDFNIGVKWVVFGIMIALVIMSAFFSMSETAFSSVSQPKLTVAIEERKAGAKKAMELTEHFDRTLTTLLIGNNLVNILLSTLAVGFFAALFVFDNNEDLWIDIISTGTITLVLLIFGEIVPKMLAKNNPEAVALKVAWIIYIIELILFPLVMIFVGIQKLISRNKEVDDEIDEEELSVIIDKMEDDGSIEDDEAQIIRNVFDLNDRTVEDIMVPRIHMEAIDYNSSLDEVKTFMLDNPYSRIPVYKRDKDHIVGILYERDFFPAVVKNPKVSWKRLLRPVRFVSSAMKVDALITELQQAKTHIAIVSGEYGEVLGMVTMEDALEELVGEIYDEHDVPGDNDIEFTQNEDGSYIVSGEMFVDDLFEKLNIGDTPEDVPSKLSGWLFANAESLPEVGFEMSYTAIYTMLNDETEEYTDYAKVMTLKIYEVKDRSISRIMISLRDASEEEIEAKREALKED